VLLTLGACATSEPRPAYRTAISVGEAPRVLVVGVERDQANRDTVNALARELAFALSQRGHPATDLAAFLEATDAVGRPVSEELRALLLRGVTDPALVTYLTTEGLQRLIVLEIQIYEQVWSETGKRTRVGVLARGRELGGRSGEAAWRVYTAPDTEDERGRGFQLATAATLGALARIIVGEPEPVAVPGTVGPTIDRALAPVIDTFNKLKWW
jgi:hypothetical protein